jgi:EAL domain-containing protein (putative c-di-GMP-specific phosphodiesterase class I)
VAEGVENQQQVDYLQTIGCHAAQGNFFAAPLTAAEVWKNYPAV